MDTDSGYAVGDSEEEILERTPSLVVESLLDLKDCLEAVLRERKTNGNTNEVFANGKKDEVVHKFPNSDYSVVLPGITVKNV